VWIAAWALLELIITGMGRHALSGLVHLAIGVVLFPVVAVVIYRAEDRHRRGGH